MKDYRYFLNENKQDILPLQILMRGNIGLTSKEEDFTKEAMKYLYDKYIRLVLIKGDNQYNTDKEVPDNRKNKLTYEFPILNMTSTSYDKLEHKDAIIFNQIKDYEISASKKTFQKEIGDDCDFVPNAVYSIKDIEDLKLPIIAKPAEGRSAMGIEKFDSYEDVRDSDMEFDIWTECKDLDREFRAFIMDREIILVAERITNSKNDQSVGKKDAEDKIDLVYIDQDMEELPFMDQIEKIKKKLETKVKLDFWNIDLMLDKDGKLWVPEVNGAPGIGPSHFKTIYKAWLKMAHDTEMSEEVEKDLTKIEKEHRENMKKRYPKEYKFSLAPL